MKSLLRSSSPDGESASRAHVAGYQVAAATLFDMRRWLAILLFVLLPTQMTWAAVAGYCVHQPGTLVVDHVGHHEHAPETHDADLSDLADSTASAADAHTGHVADSDGLDLGHDCGHCHGQLAGLLIGAHQLQIDRSTSAPVRAGNEPRPPSAAAEPERPQWARLA